MVVVIKNYGMVLFEWYEEKKKEIISWSVRFMDNVVCGVMKCGVTFCVFISSYLEILWEVCIKKREDMYVFDKRRVSVAKERNEGNMKKERWSINFSCIEWKKKILGGYGSKEMAYVKKQ